MERIIHNLVQGTPEWDAFRLNHDGASEAPAMLGMSKRTTRTELLQAKKLGLPKQFSTFVQERILDAGHEVEEKARPIAVEIVGEMLYPATVSLGKLSASCDGLTMDDSIAFEHKQVNKENIIIVRAGQVPEEHVPQCQQVLMVTGAEKLLFMVSDGTTENEAHVWVLPDAAWFARLLAGWKQFAEDLATYEMPAMSAVEKIVAEPVESLPAPVVQVAGKLVLTDNFKVFEERLRYFLETKLIRKPTTDQDFVDLDAQIKAMKDARTALNAAEAQMLAQVQPIDQAKKTKDMLDTLLQQNVSVAEKILTAEKERRRGEIVAGGVSAFAEYIAALNKRLGKAYMPSVPVDFGACIKGMRSLSSMEDKVAGELARGKIAASAIADKIDANLKTLAAVAPEHAALFPDTATIVLKAAEDLSALVTARISEHDAALKKRADEAAEQAREKIRKEEADKLAAAQPVAVAPALEPIASAPTSAPTSAPQTAAPSTVVSFGGGRRIAPAPAPATPPTLKLGDISARLSPITLTAEGLKTLGFTHAATAGATKLFHEADFGLICAALVRHIEAVQAKQAA